MCSVLIDDTTPKHEITKTTCRIGVKNNLETFEDGR